VRLAMPIENVASLSGDVIHVNSTPERFSKGVFDIIAKLSSLIYCVYIYYFRA
jgi:hypothetical protein